MFCRNIQLLLLDIRLLGWTERVNFKENKLFCIFITLKTSKKQASSAQKYQTFSREFTEVTEFFGKKYQKYFIGLFEKG